MSEHAESALQVDLQNRRCRRAYLLLAHMLPLPGLLLGQLSALELSLALLLWLASAGYWGWRERRAHPQRLSWDAQQGWQLHYVDQTLPVHRTASLVLGPCLLLQLDKELFFLPPAAGLNRLRRLLRVQGDG
ncbi:MAG: hypothetical protein HQL47_02565 [Gammaproteobacteria bacterium]|nr:hypothetical protein [Gammaproteobacteria bacterium]